jgi:hypothetical protein
MGDEQARAGDRGDGGGRHQRGEVMAVVGEILAVALARVLQQPSRTALPAPVQRRDREAARAQFGGDARVFLDELGAALQ